VKFIDIKGEEESLADPSTGVLIQIFGIQEQEMEKFKEYFERDKLENPDANPLKTLTNLKSCLVGYSYHPLYIKRESTGVKNSKMDKVGINVGAFDIPFYM
jgi:hypothetical protein